MLLSVKRNDVEIESGIESDSSNDIQQTTTNQGKSFENDVLFEQKTPYFKGTEPLSQNLFL